MGKRNMKKTPLLSIVVPAYNEEEVIGQCISSLINQTYTRTEIIIVDDGSTDQTQDIIKVYSKKNRKISLVEGNHEGPGYSRNLGAKHARGEILIFVDADMTFDKNYLKYLIGPIIAGECIGTEDGKQISSNIDNIWSQCWGTYFKDYIDKERGYIFRAILKKEFDKMGGFDPGYGYADDLTFYYKFGAMSRRVAGAICYHKNPSSLREVYKQSRWIGASLQWGSLNVRVIKYFVPLFMILVSPVVILLLSIIKCYRNKKFKLLIPWMIVFMTVRYLGTCVGIYRKVYLGVNAR